MFVYLCVVMLLNCLLFTIVVVIMAHRCPFIGCGMAYGRYDTMASHFASAHQNRQYVCDVCHIPFRTYSGYRRHSVQTEHVGNYLFYGQPAGTNLSLVDYSAYIAQHGSVMAQLPLVNLPFTNVSTAAVVTCNVPVLLTFPPAVASTSGLSHVAATVQSSRSGE